MLGYSANARHLRHISHSECLNTAVIKDRPNFNSSISICSNKAVHLWQAINADKRMLMTVKLDNLSLKVWIPDKDLKIKATAHNDLVFLGVGHFSDSLLMTLK